MLYQLLSEFPATVLLYSNPGIWECTSAFLMDECLLLGHEVKAFCGHTTIFLYPEEGFNTLPILIRSFV